jgi:hypothetical protein
LIVGDVAAFGATDPLTGVQTVANTHLDRTGTERLHEYL